MLTRSPEQKKLAQEIGKRFRRKRVVVTHTGNGLPAFYGTCVGVQHAKSGLYVTLATGRSFTLTPEIVTERSVEGPLQTKKGGRRRMEFALQGTTRPDAPSS